MAKKYFLMVFVLVVGIVFSSCATRLGDFTMISTKNIDWSRADEFTRYNQRVTGEDIYHTIIFIPTKYNVTIEEAVDKAIDQVPGGVALIDAVLRIKTFSLLIYGQAGYVIEGNVLVDPKLLSANEQSGTGYLVFYTDDGKEFIKKEITEEEYKDYL